MALYLALLYEEESGWQAGGEVAERGLAAHAAFQEKHAAAVRGGNALQPTSTATTLRPDGADGVTVTDGPWTETKEALGGYYLIEADDLDAALAVARDIPTPFGGVEVRPIMVFS